MVPYPPMRHKATGSIRLTDEDGNFVQSLEFNIPIDAKIEISADGLFTDDVPNVEIVVWGRATNQSTWLTIYREES